MGRPMQGAALVSHSLEFKGRRLLISNFASDRLINESLTRTGLWEPWQLDLMHRVLREDFVCVDVGANIGINALFMADCCRKGRVVAFEPFDAIYDVLRRNVEANGAGNLVAVNKGISSSAGSREMVVDAGVVGGAHVTLNPEGPHLRDGDPISTGTFRFGRLDDELQALGVSKVDFLKIDVEGHEPQVLEGAERVLRNPDLQLVIEFNPRQLRESVRSPAPFFDRRLFATLQSRFRHVFYMGRDQTLFEVRDYHELRKCLLAGGYFVDDLYCTNRVPPEVAELIVPRLQIPPRLRVTHESQRQFSVTFINRDADGWSIAEAYHPPVVFAAITGPPVGGMSLRFTRMYRKHLPEHVASWPVWVLVGDQAVSVDLLDADRELHLNYTTGAPAILLESPHQALAKDYLGNPADPRAVGFHCAVESDGGVQPG